MLISTGDVFFGKRVLVCDRRWSCFMCSWGGRVEYAACSSMYAAIRAVSGQASPRRKPTPSSVSRSPDEYDVLDSDGSLTAFALNSVVYLVPLAMVPSSPIKLEEIRNKISSYHRKRSSKKVRDSLSDLFVIGYNQCCV